MPSARCRSRSREIGEGFAAMGDAYLAARVEDIRVVGARLVRNLTKTPYAAFQQLARGHGRSSPRS